MEADGHQVDTAIDAETAQKLMRANSYDVIVSDIVLPGSSGIDLLKLQNVIAPDVPFVLVTGNPDLANASEAIRTGSAVDYLIKPVTGPELQKTVARAVEIKRVRDENRRLEAENQLYQQHLEELVQKKSEALLRAYDEVSRSYDFTLEALVAMLDAREKSAGRHSIRVREFAMILADEMDVPRDRLDDLARGTLLHDIGKIAIPDCVLLKPGKLTDVEWAVMRNHPQIGYDIIRSSKQLAGAAEIILSHHEKYDGSGYPRGLKGDEICLSARIFSVVDAYDAMRSVRVYKKAIPAEEALEEIRRCDGSLFDPEVVKAFMTCQPLLEEIAQWDTLDQELP
ncbi:MAG: HD domain-containing protein [Kiritimatiellales bacterium]|nr:HD domain-containing protein [Kiritimatiellota bacterium]MBL7012417.1 HD domain-containing protein [Kiritimatiellales bacterium]